MRLRQRQGCKNCACCAAADKFATCEWHATNITSLSVMLRVLCAFMFEYLKDNTKTQRTQRILVDRHLSIGSCYKGVVPDTDMLRVCAGITFAFCCWSPGTLARHERRAYSEYVRSEQRSQRACGPQPGGARRRAGICFVAAPRRCTPTSPASRRLASAHPALASKCQ